MRKAIGGILTVLAVLGGLLPVWGQSPPSDSSVPQTHWAYDDIQALQQIGFDTGIPDGTYSGRPGYTRRECAEITARFVNQGSIRAGVGWPELPRYWRNWSRNSDPLRMLCTEFEPQLSDRGLTPFRLSHYLERFEAVRRTGRPQGVETPLSDGLAPIDPVARREGARLARAEWVPVTSLNYRTNFLLYTPSRPDDVRTYRTGSIPFRVFTADDDRKKEVLAGHNAEMYQLARSRSEDLHPFDSWIPSVFDLPRAWRSLKNRKWMIDEKHPGAQLDSHIYRIVWDKAGPQATAVEKHSAWELQPDRRLWSPKSDRVDVRSRRLLLDDTRDHTESELYLPWPLRLGQLQLSVDEHATVCYVRLQDRADLDQPYRYYLVDLRTGAVLNAAASTD